MTSVALLVECHPLLMKLFTENKKNHFDLEKTIATDMERRGGPSRCFELKKNYSVIKRMTTCYRIP